MLPLGFQFSGVHCGIKKNAQKEDFTLIHCPKGAVAAGVYTQNLVFAAPVALDRQRTPSSDIRVVAVNSGNANACTGERGLKDAFEMARLAASAVGADEKQALVMSTGIIGVFLPMDKIAAGAKTAAVKLGNSEDSFLAAAKGITTTDKSHKVASREIQIGGKTLRIACFCKGAGMIGPNMATMLAVITTDAALTPEGAQALLKNAADESFNCISVEGHMSTNDTMLLLASGAASSAPLSGDDLKTFQAALTATSIELCKQIPDDGEGASHLICITIEGCKTRAAARQIAQSVANSALVKTAVAGADPNWGRIVSAAGYAGVSFDPAGVDLRVNGHLLYERGAPVPFDAKTVSQSIKGKRETELVLTFREGSESIRFWTSDLNADYVRFNAITPHEIAVERLRIGGIILASVVIAAVLGYRFLGGYGWSEALWMVVISITSVGYGERSTQPWYMQLFTVAVVLLGISAAGYTFGGFLQLLLAGELEDVMGHRLMKQQIDKLSGHTIICGFGRIGRTLADDMACHKQQFVIIEQNQDNLAAAREAGYLCLHGDATEDEMLLAAGCHRAKALITGLPNDAANVFITLTARNLNRDLLIVARAGHGSSERKLRQAGADKVVLPSSIGAQLMSRMIMRPNTADLMELVAEQGNLNVQLDEMRIASSCQLLGQTIRETNAHSQYRLLVLAVKQASGQMIFNPEADYKLELSDIIILMGKKSDIERFCREFAPA